MKKRKSEKSLTAPIDATGYDAVLGGLVALLESARRSSARAVNRFMTATYWEVGRRIVEGEQGGEMRAEYGKALLERLSADLTKRFGRGFSRQNLHNFRQFFLTFPEIRQTASGELAAEKRQTASGELNRRDDTMIAALKPAMSRFQLPWSSYVRLLALRNDKARQFYEAEALRCGWTVRQLDRQISSQFYERTALSRNKAAMLRGSDQTQPGDDLSPEEEIKDPFVLEFLGLKDEYSESELEEALIRHLESFLIELGGDFAFIARQRRLRVGDEWYRVHLLFFHRKLRCLVVIDLKLGKFTHADAGQMHMYLNYAREHWTNEHENPPVGLILCTQKDDAVARYSLEGLPNKVVAREYLTALPEEEILAEEIEKTRKQLEMRAARKR
ncbi:MAG: PDDEXK nuclease domain-containing protein [Verrucomicrobiota bacterium]|nr:PDDEXK nuclease domain-containing protein [Verrucomicrobiota bacterium]